MGQEVLEPSTVPTVTDTGALEPRPVGLRTFAVADGTDAHAPGVRVLPGGLTRVGAHPDSLVISSREEGTSKDTWVASSEPVLQQSPWLPAPRLRTTRVTLPEGPIPLPGRAAAQLFVLGRSAEHAELVIRLVRTVLARLDQPVGGSRDGGAQSLEVLLSALGTASGFDPASEPDDGVPASGSVSHRASQPSTAEGAGELSTDRRALALLLDVRIDGSLLSTLRVLVDAAYSVREQLSADSWQLVGDIEEEAARLRNRPPTQLVSVEPGLQRLLRSLLAFSGISAENMQRDAAWRFLDGGRRLERAQALVRLLRAVLVTTRSAVVEDLLVESMLKMSESLIIFRRQAGSVLHVAGALDLLVYDEANPHAVLYQLERLASHLADLPTQDTSRRLGAQERLALEASTLLRLTDAGRLAAVDTGSGRRLELDEVFATVDDLLAELLDSLRRTYFAHERLSMLADWRPERIGSRL